MLANTDAYVLLRLFALDRVAAESEELRRARGRCAITFEVDDDPRPVWSIDEVRAFVKELHEGLPHLPYFLDPAPALGMLITHFFPLVHPDGLIDGGVNLAHDSF